MKLKKITLELFRVQKLSDLSARSALVYLGLFLLRDADGFIPYKTHWIHEQISPQCDRTHLTEESIDQLLKAGLLLIFQRDEEEFLFWCDGSETSIPAKDLFPFDQVYEKYPRKEGRTKGIQKCRSQIKTLERYQDLLKSVVNYSSQCEGIEVKYIKHFDTFMGCWEDYIEGPVTNLKPVVFE